MNEIFLKIRNFLPYLCLISIYFFFINIEARNNQKYTNNNYKIQDKLIESGKYDKKSNVRIVIPIIPYNQ